MISYDTFCRIHAMHKQEGLNAPQIAAELDLHTTTVLRWLEKEQYTPRKTFKRSSLLDPYKDSIVRMLLMHDYSATQIFQKIREAGYEGGYTILKEFVRKARPPRNTAYLKLSFDPGECAQVDWGSAGTVQVGSTRRRLSFFVMVLGYSRMIYVEFVLAETMEHFLSCHEHAFEYFGGCPKEIWVDNLKCAVLDHPQNGEVKYNPRYLDFARHYGFEAKACNVRKPNEKGRVENGVGYVKKNFLRGLEIDTFVPLNPAVHLWCDTVANHRIHGTTHKQPIVLFEEEKADLIPLNLAPYDVGINHAVPSNNQFRVSFQTNHYSVPAEYASRRVTLRIYPEKLLIYHEQKLIAEHSRNYDRHQDILNPDHQRKLLQQKRNARNRQQLMRLLRIAPRAEEFYRELKERRMNPLIHVRKIIALSEIYGEDATRRAIEDAIEYQAFSAEYIANILEQRTRNLPEPGALHLTRREDLLDIDLPEPDISIYDDPQEPEESNNSNDKEDPS